ncbi:type II toxin-antitoxin system VapC family toxin [Natronorarus salvus]|uniref:type II toxin-antitoxin system VapC family toxin n=1 Tax=Natronorarus salvus TaxID=3117733 RepID=UPI002F2600C9
MILDTTFLHDLMYSDTDAVETAERIEATGQSIRLSAMSVYELYYGVGYTDQPDEERRKVENVIGSLPIAHADGVVMRRAGRIDGALEREGTKTGQSDLIVGATALVRDEPVLTRNVTDFERIPGVEVETY